MDFIDSEIKQLGIKTHESIENDYSLDLVWYLWSGAKSPLFGKDKMATFERSFLKDKALGKEERSSYYRFRDDPAICEMILSDFGLLSKDAIIVNGHVPVSVKNGESPIKAGGKLIVIDGGFSSSYQEVTGIAGYTLIHNENGRQLVAHKSFVSKEQSIKKNLDVVSGKTIDINPQTKPFPT